tara:strand:+ start:220 stop:393 length:174 start_codon:yes stop_codon:yes gene_type:complete
MLGIIFDMMTEKEFWDMFHKKHNPKYSYEKEKEKTKQKKNKKQKNNPFKFEIFRKSD